MADTRTYRINLSPDLSRRVDRWLEARGVTDASALVTTALERHFVDGDSPPAPVDTIDLTDSSLTALLARPGDTDVAVADPQPAGVTLEFMTNRLNPMALAARVLVNMTITGGPPAWGDFVDTTAAVARTVGLRLEAEDRRAGVRQNQRRFTGWPVGTNGAKALARFRTAYLVHPPSHRWQGPLAELGLAVLHDGTVLLTPLGLDLGRAPSAILGEGDGHVLTRNQEEILRRALMVATAERAAMAEFVQAVAGTDTTLGAIDQRLGRTHRTWSAERIVTHRAAMVGRLRDVGVITLEGRGSDARVTIVEGTVRV